jgi:hypothetical protein
MLQAFSCSPKGIRGFWVQGLWHLAAVHGLLAAAEGCPTFDDFWLISTFRNPQSEIRIHLDLPSVI